MEDVEVREGGCGEVRDGGCGEVRDGGCGEVRDGGCGEVRDGGCGEVRDGECGEVRDGGWLIQITTIKDHWNVNSNISVQHSHPSPLDHTHPATITRSQHHTSTQLCARYIADTVHSYNCHAVIV